MAKQIKTSTNPLGGERKALIVSAVIMVAFFLFVAIATKGSLTYYAIPHAVLGLAVVIALFFLDSMPKRFVRLLVILAIIGAVSAIGVAVAYLPYYSQYLNYANSQ